MYHPKPMAPMQLPGLTEWAFPKDFTQAVNCDLFQVYFKKRIGGFCWSESFSSPAGGPTERGGCDKLCSLISGIPQEGQLERLLPEDSRMHLVSQESLKAEDLSWRTFANSIETSAWCIYCLQQPNKKINESVCVSGALIWRRWCCGHVHCRGSSWSCSHAELKRVRWKMDCIYTVLY